MERLIDNRVTEYDIRDWLNRNGFAGSTSRFEELELHALMRPGWLQVFRFSVWVRASTANLPMSNAVEQMMDEVDADEFELDDEGNELETVPQPLVIMFGTVVDDERKRTAAAKTKVEIFSSQSERDARLAELSEGLMTCRTGQAGLLPYSLAVFGSFVGLIGLFRWLLN